MYQDSNGQKYAADVYECQHEAQDKALRMQDIQTNTWVICREMRKKVSK